MTNPCDAKQSAPGERKAIGFLMPCPDCGKMDCYARYLRWEIKRGIDLNARDHHLVTGKP